MSNKGSVLVVTLGFILIFTLLGVGSLSHAGFQSEAAEKRKQSVEAFWLADAGIERAKNKLKKTPSVTIPESNAAENLGDGTYDVYSVPDPDCSWCSDRWLVNSQGVINNQKRTIKAIIAKSDVKNVLTTEGPIKDFDSCPMGSVTVDCSLVKEDTDISMESVIGASESDVIAAAEHTYINPSNSGDVNPIGGVTVIFLTENNHSLNLTTDNQVSPAFLLIDTTQVTANPDPNITIAGSGDFVGIIWIVGKANLQGTTGISGSVFVESGSVLETKLTGNAALTYDTTAINDAIDALGGALGGGTEVGVPHIISYDES